MLSWFQTVVACLMPRWERRFEPSACDSWFWLSVCLPDWASAVSVTSSTAALPAPPTVTPAAMPAPIDVLIAFLHPWGRVGDETILYDAPTDYGSIGAIWVKGIGFLHAPLPAGEHVLHLVEYNDEIGVGYDNTWTITVE